MSEASKRKMGDPDGPVVVDEPSLSDLMSELRLINSQLKGLPPLQAAVENHESRLTTLESRFGALERTASERLSLIESSSSACTQPSSALWLSGGWESKGQAEAGKLELQKLGQPVDSWISEKPNKIMVFMRFASEMSRTSFRTQACAYLAEKFPKVWQKDARSEEMERALRKAQRLCDILKNDINEQHMAGRYTVKMHTRDASISVEDIQNNTVTKLARFNDNKERFAWEKIKAIARVSQSSIENDLIAYDELP